MSEQEVVSAKVQVTLAPDVLDRLRNAAQRDQRSVAGLIRKIVHQHLEQPLRAGVAA